MSLYDGSNDARARELHLACVYYAKGNKYAALAVRYADPVWAVDARRQAVAYRELARMIAARLVGL